MKKNLKKGRAVLSAWSLITAMGLTPVLSVAYPSGSAVVYAKESQEDDREKTEAADQQARYDENMEQLATPSEAERENDEETLLESEQGEVPDIEEEEADLPAGIIQDMGEKATATPSNAMISLLSSSLWGGIEMSDHLDGEGTEEEPYEINSANDLRLLAYNVANEEVDGYAGCYFVLTRDISLSDTASWLPIGYFTETGDSEPMPFKGNFDGQGYRIYNLKISDTTQDYAGLFGCLHGATIKNLTVDGQVNANSKAAILAGEINDSVIENCTSLGQVRGVGAIGGIAGEAYDSVMLECTNTAGVLGGTDAEAEEEAFAGGICGSAHTSFTVSYTHLTLPTKA